MTIIRKDQDRTPSADTSRRWWLIECSEETDGRVADSVISAYLDLVHRQGERIRQMMVAAKLYSNLPLWGGGLNNISGPVMGRGTQGERVNFNVVQSVVDSAHAKMMKNEPWPYFLTSGGDYKQQSRAKRLNKFIDGLFMKNKIYELTSEAFRDGEIWGTGCLHGHIMDGQPVFERVLPFELLVDEIEAFYGDPRQMYRTKAIDRQVLRENVRRWCKDDKKLLERLLAAVDRASPGTSDRSVTASTQTATADVVEVIEAWHLPDGTGATTDDPLFGRHIVAVPGACLVDEPYTRSRFPFVFFRWSKRPFGFWGQGLSEQLAGIQLELNKIMWLIQRSIQLGGNFKIWLADACNIADEHITGQIGSIMRGGSTPPQYIVTDPVPQSVYSYRDKLIQNAYEQAGITQMSAQGVKPEGLNSGVALREYNNIESDRFMTVGKNYERLFVDLTELTIDLCNEAAAVKNFKVKVPFHGRLQEFDWKSVQMTEEQYALQVFPISRLPQDPAGRQQTIVEWAQAGWLAPDAARRLQGFPDMESVVSLQDSQTDYLAKILDQIVEENIFTTPSSYDDLTQARSMALQYLARGQTDGLEPEKLASLRQFIVQIDMLEKAAQKLAQQQAQTQALQQAQTQAAVNNTVTPQNPPQQAQRSDLVQNVPGVQGGQNGQ